MILIDTKYVSNYNVCWDYNARNGNGYNGN